MVAAGYMQDEGSERGDESLQGAWTRENVGPPQVPTAHVTQVCGPGWLFRARGVQGKGSMSVLCSGVELSVSAAARQVPRQQDGSSCGVFLCAFADCLSVGQEPAGFTQHHIKSMRKAMRQFLGQCRM